MKKQVFLLIVICQMVLAAPTGALADYSDILNRFHPYLSFQEEYTDNLDLTPINRREDWITTVGLGLRFSTLPVSSEVPGQINTPPPSPPQGIDLDYMLGLVFYAKNPDDNYVSHSGRIHAWATLDRALTFRLRTASSVPGTQGKGLLFCRPPGQLLPGTQRKGHLIFEMFWSLPWNIGLARKICLPSIIAIIFMRRRGGPLKIARKTF